MVARRIFYQGIKELSRVVSYCCVFLLWVGVATSLFMELTYDGTMADAIRILISVLRDECFPTLVFTVVGFHADGVICNQIRTGTNRRILTVYLKHSIAIGINTC